MWRREIALAKNKSDYDLEKAVDEERRIHKGNETPRLRALLEERQQREVNPLRGP